MSRFVSTVAALVFAAAALGTGPATADSIVTTDAFLPAVNITGATGVYRTDVWIFNPEASLDNNVKLYFTPAGVDGTGLAGITITPPLSPRESVTMTDILRNYFKVTDTYGLLEIRSDYPVMVTSNTYNVAGATPGTYGQFTVTQSAVRRASSSIRACFMQACAPQATSALRGKSSLSRSWFSTGIRTRSRTSA